MISIPIYIYIFNNVNLIVFFLLVDTTQTTILYNELMNKYPTNDSQDQIYKFNKTIECFKSDENKSFNECHHHPHHQQQQLETFLISTESDSFINIPSVRFIILLVFFSSYFIVRINT